MLYKTYFIPTLTILVTLLLFSCTQPNTLTEAEKKEGWVLLFDGKTTKGWHMYNHAKMIPAWVAINGELTSDVNEKTGFRGDIISDTTYENFELLFEWKIAKEGNSGVFINVQEDTAYIAPRATGPEYQLLDNANMKADYLKDGKKSAGTMYGLTMLKNPVEPKPFGKWNQSQIIQKNGQISFRLNGIITCEEDMKSAHWKEQVIVTKSIAFPDFGKTSKGHIVLQDWAKGVSFRNIKIKELK